MADIKVEGEMLRKFIKLAQTQPLPFGFCPGPSDEDHVLMIDRKRKPGLLGKSARIEGLGSKVACGTFEVTGRDMILTCERTTSGLDKKMIRFLKVNNVKLNVVVVDPAGEDTPDAPAQNAPAQPDDDRRAALVARLREVQPRISALPGEAGEKLNKAARIVAKLIASNDLVRAEQTLDKIARALG